jgi:hypothetical protein
MPTFDLHTDDLRREMEGLNRLADSFGQKLVTSLAGAVIHGRKLSDVFQSLALSLSNQALSAALRPLGNLAGDAISTAFAPIAATTLGSTASASKRSPTPAGVIVNISTPDIQSFRQSQGQVASAIARAVAKGQRNL